ncbi:MAG: DUF2029 domain-containing protein [Candidatus Omnitrophota bacterium]|nr:MAG: DUF2029 domain-containing protein [Candidatus Omnitrophota bacterium]
MPFTMHSRDLVFINYFPFIFVEKGIWDPYGFITSNSQYFGMVYYGPVLFFIMSIANFIIIKLFNPTTLITILELSGRMMSESLTTLDYVHAFSNLDFFKNLFLMKSPYLIFDFFIGWMLLKLALSKDLALKSYKLWMLNIVVLHSAYMVGQADLIPALFITAALYVAWVKRPYFSVVLLSLAGATKLFPYILVLPACLLLGEGWKKKFSLMFTAAATTVFSYLPFYLSSGNSVFTFFISSRIAQYAGITKWILPGISMVLYSLVCTSAAKDSRKPNPEGSLVYYFAVVMFLGYMTFPAKLRYFVYITPALALIIPQYKKFSIFTLSVILMIMFQSLTHRGVQLGLFTPLNPAYFSNLPTIQEIMGRFVNIEICYKVVARILLLIFLTGAWWVWRIGVKAGACAKKEALC